MLPHVHNGGLFSILYQYCHYPFTNSYHSTIHVTQAHTVGTGKPFLCMSWSTLSQLLFSVACLSSACLCLCMPLVMNAVMVQETFTYNYIGKNFVT